MKLPRFRIVWLMAVVAIIALDCVVVRELAQSRLFSAFTEWCFVGALPMANILAIGIYRLAILKRRESRPFLLGFGFFGAAAMVLSLASAWFFPDAVRYPFRRSLNPIFESMGSPDGSRPIFLAVVAAFSLLPQILLGLFGGFLFSRFGLATQPD